jgi:hypothetical protein
MCEVETVLLNKNAFVSDSNNSFLLIYIISNSFIVCMTNCDLRLKNVSFCGYPA